MTEREARTGEGRIGTVLLVEDSGVVRDVIARMLADGGFNVIKASGGEEALSLSRRGDVPFDLLLTDIVMPGMDGLELADRMAGERPGLRILFMTGYAADRIVNERILGKSMEYIGKPFSQGEILTKVRKILSR